MYTVADFLIRIKNAYMGRKRTVNLPYSKAVLSIGKILAEEGYIRSIEEKETNGIKMLVGELLYKGKERRSALSDVQIVSKPSVHVYMRKSQARVGGHGVAILSTSRGFMTHKKAQKAGIGGELLCKIR